MKKATSAMIPLGLLFLLLQTRIDKTDFYLKYGLLTLSIAFFIAGFVAILKRKENS